jgi:hypothetical protein
MDDVDTEGLARRNRLVAEGKLITFEPVSPVPSLDEIEELSRGWGTAVSEALDWTEASGDGTRNRNQRIRGAVSVELFAGIAVRDFAGALAWYGPSRSPSPS